MVMERSELAYIAGYANTIKPTWNAFEFAAYAFELFSPTCDRKLFACSVEVFKVATTKTKKAFPIPRLHASGKIYCGTIPCANHA